MWKANNLGVVLMEQNLRESEICFQCQNFSKYQLHCSVWQTRLHLPGSQKPLQEHTQTHTDCSLPSLRACPGAAGAPVPPAGSCGAVPALLGTRSGCLLSTVPDVNVFIFQYLFLPGSW